MFINPTIDTSIILDQILTILVIVLYIWVAVYIALQLRQLQILRQKVKTSADEYLKIASVIYVFLHLILLFVIIILLL